jgi:hypothetical protein
MVCVGSKLKYHEKLFAAYANQSLLDDVIKFSSTFFVLGIALGIILVKIH